ncbi:uncharacterized protein EI90DRAFT_3060881 [Cantharellus anzutake]|uniref:uncharacterized protein n=1 Tax=Cantharellus anzutake TaxID=1750568 RepID=UPI001905702F|nr:uncharacterized protein EI90DRAFT_3060881 [Cantharellus anzutake]KAF8330151.1 hypothetical protein EI90DRAFT_3060881 [Cantharellus anzutake]
MTLPSELLAEIASYLPSRHSVAGYVVDSTDLIALSMTSRWIRVACVPILFRDVPILSAGALYALQSLPSHLVGYIKELNIFLDSPFLDAFKIWSSSQSQYCTFGFSPFLSLSRILSRTPEIRALRMLVAKPSGSDSAWARCPLGRALGISMDSAMQSSLALSSQTAFKLRSLRIIQLDGFQGITPLLQLAPNLQVLHLRLTAGFAHSVNDELVNAARLVPGLRELVYTPDSLRTSFPSAFNGAGGGHPEMGMEMDETNMKFNASSSVGMLKALGETLPHLRILDLQTRWHGNEVLFCSSSEPIDPEALIDVIKYLPNLEHLYLPSSVHHHKDYAILRTPFVRPTSPSHTLTAIQARAEAINRVGQSEAYVIHRIQQQQQQQQYTTAAHGRIRSIGFVRHACAEDRIEYRVSYERFSVSELGGGGDPTIQVKISAAGEGIHCALPTPTPRISSLLSQSIASLFAMPPALWTTTTTPPHYSSEFALTGMGDMWGGRRSVNGALVSSPSSLEDPICVR